MFWPCTLSIHATNLSSTLLGSDERANKSHISGGICLRSWLVLVLMPVFMMELKDSLTFAMRVLPGGGPI